MSLRCLEKPPKGGFFICYICIYFVIYFIKLYNIPQAYVSFNDNDTKELGTVGTWHKVPVGIVPAGHINSVIEFTFDKNTQGDFNTINATILNDNTNGQLVLKKVTYLTKQNFKATF